MVEPFSIKNQTRETRRPSESKPRNPRKGFKKFAKKISKTWQRYKSSEGTDNYNKVRNLKSKLLWVRISLNFFVVRPFSYLRSFVYFTSTSLAKLYFCQNFTSTKTVQRSKYASRSTEKVELMRTPKTQIFFPKNKK